jgi:hypothetical protein
MTPAGRTTFLAVVVVMAIALGAGAVGYVLGSRGGHDLGAARAAGRREGAVRGSVLGAQRGYDAGMLAGRHAGFKRTYKPRFRAACRKAVAASNTTIGPVEACP